MFRSFRRRILFWHALTLIVVVGAFAGLLYWNVRSARLEEINTQLLGAAQVLAAGMRGLPRHELSGEPPPPRDGARPSEEERESLGDAAREPGGPLEGDRPRDRRRPPPRRPPPPGEFDRPPRDDLGPLPPDEFEPPPPESTRRHTQRVISELALPASLQTPPDDPAGPPYFLIWRRNGERLKASPEAPRISPADAPRGLIDGQYQFEQHREVREIALGGPEGSLIVVGRPTGREFRELRQLALRLAAIGAAVTLMGAFGGAVLARHVVRPLEAMSAAASAISATNLSQRIDPATFDRELQSLAGTLNETFARLEAAFERQSRFTADASHELRTPLSVLASHLEFALSRPSLDADQRETLEACQRAARRMKSLVEALLLLARADAGNLSIARQSCDLAGIVEECAEMLRPLAVQKNAELTLELEPCELEGDPALLGQLAVNLLTNAIHYNRPGGRVLASVRAESGRAVLVVEDAGEGIPPGEQAHLFERFYRIDKARSREDGGNGLGLSIVKSIVDLHRGEISFESQPGQGARFTVRLPLGHVEARRETGERGASAPR
jgi:heavy metal sensor kinase